LNDCSTIQEAESSVLMLCGLKVGDVLKIKKIVKNMEEFRAHGPPPANTSCKSHNEVSNQCITIQKTLLDRVHIITLFDSLCVLFNTF
jgi:flagellar motor switch protein FliM